MLKKCHGCGVKKDPAVLEPYSHPETERICDGPIPPFFKLEVQPTREEDDYREATVCHECFHKIDPDMWIDQKGWESLPPTTTFAELPRWKDRIT